MISEEDENEERMDTTQDFEPVQAGQQMLAKEAGITGFAALAAELKGGVRR